MNRSPDVLGENITTLMISHIVRMMSSNMLTFISSSKDVSIIIIFIAIHFCLSDSTYRFYSQKLYSFFQFVSMKQEQQAEEEEEEESIFFFISIISFSSPGQNP